MAAPPTLHSRATIWMLLIIALCAVYLLSIPWVHGLGLKNRSLGSVTQSYCRPGFWIYKQPSLLKTTKSYSFWAYQKMGLTFNNYMPDYFMSERVGRPVLAPSAKP